MKSLSTELFSQCVLAPAKPAGTHRLTDTERVGGRGKTLTEFFPVLYWREYTQALALCNNWISAEAAPSALQEECFIQLQLNCWESIMHWTHRASGKTSHEAAKWIQHLTDTLQNTLVWIFSLSWLPMPCLCEKLQHFFCDQLPVRWMQHKNCHHFNTCYFSNSRQQWRNWIYSRIYFRALEKVDDGLTSPPIVIGDCSSITRLLCSAMAKPHCSTHLVSLAHTTRQRVKPKLRDT